jgi:pimeloyl-ACP methyl ester carboxylesterase
VSELTLNGARIHFERTGSGFPILFIHAGIADSRMWEPQATALADQFDMVRPDLRGYGDSELPPAPYAMRSDLIALMDALGLGRFHLVGCSMGGSVAIDLALENPGRVKKLILVGAGVGGANFGQADSALFADGEAAYERRDFEALNKAEVRLWVDGPRRAEGAAPAAVRDLVLDMNGRAMRSDFDAAEHQRLDPPAKDRLGEIKAPTLVIVGSEDLPHMDVAANFLTSNIAGARKVVMSDAAHLPNLEHPDEFNQLLVDFLAEGD